MSSEAEIPEGKGSVRSRAGRRPRTEAEDATPRTGAKRTLVDVIKQIPAYLRLLGGLLTDRRVSGLDKLLVAGAIAYIVSPMDLDRKSTRLNSSHVVTSRMPSSA